MPWFRVDGHFKRTTQVATWLEIEAPDQAAAIEQAKEEDANADLEWRDEEISDGDVTWTAKTFTPSSQE